MTQKSGKYMITPPYLSLYSHFSIEQEHFHVPSRSCQSVTLQTDASTRLDTTNLTLRSLHIARICGRATILEPDVMQCAAFTGVKLKVEAIIAQTARTLK